jgi:hypothetical protein
MPRLNPPRNPKPSTPSSVPSVTELEAKLTDRLGTGAQGPQPGRKREHSYARGREKSGGRQRGTPNTITKEVRTAIVQGLSELGDAGEDGLVGYVRWLGRDRAVGAMLLRSVLPLETIRTTVEIQTAEQLNASLVASGLPTMDRLFARSAFELDYKGTPIEDAEIVESGPEKIIK